jgi:hypothetical protein
MERGLPEEGEVDRVRHFLIAGVVGMKLIAGREARQNTSSARPCDLLPIKRLHQPRPCDYSGRIALIPPRSEVDVGSH